MEESDPELGQMLLSLSHRVQTVGKTSWEVLLSNVST